MKLQIFVLMGVQIVTFALIKVEHVGVTIQIVRPIAKRI